MRWEECFACCSRRTSVLFACGHKVYCKVCYDENDICKRCPYHKDITDFTLCHSITMRMWDGSEEDQPWGVESFDDDNYGNIIVIIVIIIVIAIL